VREQLDVLDCRSLICLVKEVRRRGKEPVVETHFFMSSLDPDKVSAKEFQDIILRHWEVENCLHCVKDVEYREDKHRGGSSWGVTWSVLRNMAVSLVRLLRRKEEIPLRAVHERCAAFPIETAKILGLDNIRETC
jgi:predicted transposase YbfD/YdcC